MGQKSKPEEEFVYILIDYNDYGRIIFETIEDVKNYYEDYSPNYIAGTEVYKAVKMSVKPNLSIK